MTRKPKILGLLELCAKQEIMAVNKGLPHMGLQTVRSVIASLLFVSRSTDMRYLDKPRASPVHFFSF